MSKPIRMILEPRSASATVISNMMAMLNLQKRPMCPFGHRYELSGRTEAMLGHKGTRLGRVNDILPRERGAVLTPASG